MQLFPWSHDTSAGFALRGWHTAPSGKPLLHFLHGNGFCTRTYEPLLAALSDDFDLWLCDLQGHGESEHGGHFVGWNRNAELAYEAFQAGNGQFGTVPHLACGHSFGGVLTSLIMAQHPQAFQAAVLLDPVLFPQSLIALRQSLSLIGVRRNPIADKARARRHHWPDRDTAYGALHNRGMFRGWEEAAFRAHIEHALRDHAELGVELKCRPSREAEVFDSMPQRLWASLRRVRTPTRVIYGDQSYPFVRQAVTRWAKLNAQVSAESITGGHCFMQEDSSAAAQRVSAFLLDQSTEVA
ncbi:alpha/beta fold hydrolase [Halopseudomonas salegens]|uniref:Pimeloyl-ACP methyl ester carboxylesterase n=1 Tax=Halopseudomonas salegens TaxID=1434072 RepID=A0A1H2GEH6_9GAMM|nr:alpha/beta hydrolase [Halopseudomonas salegens]SDU18017.1 Pimeloyl-ACP methyl ester carboxylesterase [Halopseudomonas salegens]